jgi:hypothetical protein
LAVLYGIGFLGVIRNHESAFIYNDQKTIQASEDEFLIHPCFRDALRSTSAIGMAGFESSMVSPETLVSRVDQGVSMVAGRDVIQRIGRSYRRLQYIEEVCRRVDAAFTSSKLVI